MAYIIEHHVGGRNELVRHYSDLLEEAFCDDDYYFTIWYNEKKDLPLEIYEGKGRKKQWIYSSSLTLEIAKEHCDNTLFLIRDALLRANPVLN